MGVILRFDIWVINIINETFGSSETILDIFEAITKLGDAGAIWILFGIILTIKKDTKRYGILMLCSIIGGYILGDLVLKNLFQRERPFVKMGIMPFIKPPSGFSFPSGHSVSSFVGATSIYFSNKRFGIFAYALAVLIAVSRVVLLVHYPSDIIAGSLIGIFVTFVIFEIGFKTLKI